MKFHIRTYGCQMNERDSESVAADLLSRGYQRTESEEDADIILLNTCSVRERAERKAIGKLGITSRLKRNKPDLLIGLMGCMAQRIGGELAETVEHLDFVVGTGQTHRTGEIIDSLVSDRRKLIETGHDSGILTGMAGHINPGLKVSAFIAIMRGCNRFCSYCIVPYVRGREKSRMPDDIAAEARELAAAGVREIFLLGQNVAAYGMDGAAPPPPPGFSPFAELLEELAAIDGVERIRFTSPHPAYFNDRLIGTIIAEPKVCDAIHLPLQSGSDRILKLMNRPYTAVEYRQVVDKLKSGLSDVSFSTDVIVGFPGETEDDFNATRGLMNEVGFDNAFIFKYSPREGTTAAGMDDQVPEKVKEDRNQILLSDLERRCGVRNAAMSGRKIEILVEGPSKRNPARWSGRATNGKMVVFEPTPNTAAGDLVTLEIKSSTPMTLFGAVPE